MEFNEFIKKGIELIYSESFEESIALAKELQQNDPESADGFHLEAIALQHQYKWQDSITTLNKAIENAPYDASLYSLRAFAKMSTEDLIGAEQDLNEAIELEDFEPAHRNMVILNIVRNNSEDAISYLVDRLQKNPADIDNWILMGDLMAKAGMDEKAESYYNQARQINPDHPYLKQSEQG